MEIKRAYQIESNGRKIQREKLREVLKEGENRRSPYYTFQASYKRARLIGNLFLKAYNPESLVVWRNIIMPTEIFYAMDIIPLCVESVSAMLATSKVSRRAVNVAEAHHYSSDICSFLKCTIGASIEDYLPTPDFLACTSYYCDGCTAMFEILSKRYNRDFFHIDVPYNYNSRESIDYVARQLEEMAKVIGKRTKRKIDQDRLAEAISFSNQARKYFLKINKIRQQPPSRILGGEAIDYAAMLAYTWGSKDIVEIYKLFYEELLERVNKDILPLKEERFRILWRHLKPYYDDTILNHIENYHGAIIAFEEVNFIHWEEMDPKDPYRSLARKLLSNPPVGPFQHWIDATLSFVEDYKIDGVVSFAHWGCRQLNSGIYMIKDILNKIGIPVLELDGDCIDPRNYSDGQVKTRIDAFIELLEKKK